MRDIDPTRDRHHLLCFAACAKTFAMAVEAMFQDATGDSFTYEPDSRRMHAGDGNIAETMWAEMQRFCQRFGIGIHQPQAQSEITTKGDPVTVVEVDAESRCPTCGSSQGCGCYVPPSQTKEGT